MVNLEDGTIGPWAQLLNSSQCPNCMKTLNFKVIMPEGQSVENNPIAIGFEARHCQHVYSLMPQTATIRMTRDPNATVPEVKQLDKAVHEEEKKAAQTEQKGETLSSRNPTQKAQEDVFNKSSNSSKDSQSQEKASNSKEKAKENSSSSKYSSSKK